MDECPRCRSPLERLSLDGVSTIACTQCGYADVPIEHTSDRSDPESWREAIRRFYDGD